MSCGVDPAGRGRPPQPGRHQTRDIVLPGIRAATIHSENLEDWAQVETDLQASRVDVLMVSPERLGNPAFLQKLLPLIQGSIGKFVVDEAHCISDWGLDFRPDYRRIVRILHLLPPRVPVLCTTATAAAFFLRFCMPDSLHKVARLESPFPGASPQHVRNGLP
jgi:hypothetical protein